MAIDMNTILILLPIALAAGVLFHLYMTPARPVGGPSFRDPIHIFRAVMEASAQLGEKSPGHRSGPGSSIPVPQSRGMVWLNFALLVPVCLACAAQSFWVLGDIAAIFISMIAAGLSVVFARGKSGTGPCAAAIALGLAPLSILPLSPEIAGLASLCLGAAGSVFLFGSAAKIAITGSLVWPGIWFAVSYWSSPDPVFTASWLLALTLILAMYHSDRFTAGTVQNTSALKDLASPGYAWASPWFILLCVQSGFDPLALTALLIYTLTPLVYGLAGLDTGSMRLTALLTLPLTFALFPALPSGGEVPAELAAQAHAMMTMAILLSFVTWGSASITLRNSLFAQDWAIQGAALPVLLLSIAAQKTGVESQSIPMSFVWGLTAASMFFSIRSLSHYRIENVAVLNIFSFAMGASLAMAVGHLFPGIWSAMAIAALGLAFTWLWRSTLLANLEYVILACALLTGAYSLSAIDSFSATVAASGISDPRLNIAAWLLFVFGLPAWITWISGRMLETEESDSISTTISTVSALLFAFLVATGFTLILPSGLIGSGIIARSLPVVLWLFIAIAFLLHRSFFPDDGPGMPLFSGDVCLWAARGSLTIFALLAIATTASILQVGGV